MSKDDFDAGDTLTLKATLQEANPDPNAQPVTADMTINFRAVDEQTQDIQTNNAISGDMQPLLDGDGNEKHDQWDNIIPIGPAPGRGDAINDTPGNDYITAGDGNDAVWKVRGGDDIIDLGAGDDNFWTTYGAYGHVHVYGGDGRDYLGAWSGKDILEGGDGADGLYGSLENDQLYGDAKGNAQDFITQGATQQGNNQQGEWFDAEDGDDQVFGGAGNDFAAGGGGNDLIVTGGGTDWIWGDWNTWSPETEPWRDWTITERIETEADGGKTYYYDVAHIFGESSDGTGDDVIYAGAGDDVANGERGDDTIYLEDGNDKAWGDEGDDVILGGAGNDLINGDNGHKFLDSSLHGNDFLDGGDGNDELFGEGGADALYGGAGDDKLWGESGSVLPDYQGDDYLDGEDGNDELGGGGGADMLYGGAGNDKLYGDSSDTPEEKQGDDYLDGEDGNDELIGGGGADTLFGGDGDDKLYGEASDTPASVQGDDYLDGEAGKDILVGGGGADILYGGTEDDELYGDAADTPDSAHGDDFLDGEEGNDTLVGARGSDTLMGGKGDDILDGDGANINAALHGDDYLDGGDGNDTLIGEGGADTLIGGAGNDSLYGDDGDDYLEGGDGNDVLVAGAGSDTLNGGDGVDLYVYNLGDGMDTIVDSGSNTLSFGLGIGANSLTLELGSLLIKVGDSGDEIHLANFDPYDVAAGAGIDRFEFANGQVLTFEQLIARGFDLNGTSEDDFIIGTSVTDRINTFAGNDAVVGLAGDDIIDGGIGDDDLYGDEGNDQLFGSDGVDLLDGGVGDDLLDGGTGDDALYGSEGNDQLFGSDGADVLDGGEGADTLDGGAGDDALYGSEGNDQLLGSDGADLLDGGNGDDTLGGGAGDDALYGSEGNDQLFGSDGADLLDGGAGNDALDGGTGADSMAGGLGNDVYFVDDAGDAVQENIGEGDDSVRSSFSYTLGANVENLDLVGAGSLVGVGNELNNRIQGNNDGNALYGLAGNDSLHGGTGNDLLDGGAGIDWMVGGAGNDTYVVDDQYDFAMENEGGLTYSVYPLGLSSYSAQIIGQSGDGYTDTVESAVSYTLRDRLENLTLTGTDAINGTGNAFRNVLIGNDASNVLTGDVPHSYFPYYSDAQAMLTDRVNRAIQDGAIPYTGGYITVNFLSGQGDTLDGQGGDDTLIGTLDHDTLIGGEGNDVLQGGVGTDTLIGGAGDDTYVIDKADVHIYAWDAHLYMLDTAGDVLVEAANEGNDTVVSGLNYTLLQNFENLTLTGSANLGIGNELDNRLIATSYQATLRGLAGNDTLLGGNGWDTLDGGTGADHMEGGYGGDTYIVDDAGDQVVETDPWYTDVVQSSIDYTLGANVENLTLTGTTALFGVGNELGNYIQGNSANNLLSGLDGHDTVLGQDGNDLVDGGLGDDYLSGDAGDDTLLGGDGADWLDGGSGIDFMDGGAGDDKYYVDSTGDVTDESTGSGHDLVYAYITHTLAGGLEDLYLVGYAPMDGTGNELDNLIVGNGYANTLQGLDGNDTLDGGWGDADTMLGGAGNDLYVVHSTADLAIENIGEGHDTVESYATYTLADNVEDLRLLGEFEDYGYADALDGTGNALDNVISGNDGTNTLLGLGGNDDVNGQAGDDSISGNDGDDVLYGGDDAIYHEECGYGGPREEAFALIGDGEIVGGGSGYRETLASNSDTLSGGAGNDMIDGGSGDDFLYGDDGDDTLYGGDDGLVAYTDCNAGSEYYGGEFASTYVSSMEEDDSIPSATTTGADTNFYLEGMIGDGPYVDPNWGWGSGTVSGYDYDFYKFENVSAGATFTAAGFAQNYFENYFDLEMGLYDASGNLLVANDFGYGAGGSWNDQDPYFEFSIPYSGDFYLAFWDASNDFTLDPLVAGSNGDIYQYFFEAGGYTANVTLTSASSYFLSNDDYLDGGAGNDEIDGGSGNDTLMGGEGEDHLVGGADGYLNTTNDDYLDGGVGLDVMEGGTGDDVYIVDGIYVPIPADPPTGTSGGSGTGSSTGGTSGGSGESCASESDDSEEDSDQEDDDEAYSEEGVSSSESEEGDEGGEDDEDAECATGESEDDDHEDGEGDEHDEDEECEACCSCDTGASDAGGGTGNTGGGTNGGGTNSGFMLLADTVIENADEGYDIVYSSVDYTLTPNVEELHLTGTALNGTGNALDNVIVGNDGANRLDGGLGADYLAGGLGDDVYVLDDTGDVVDELPGEGNDTVEAGIDYTLGNTVENLVLTGSAIVGIGNDLDNTLTGNAQENVLDGGLGNDTLDGGAGADLLLGGAGDDTYVSRMGDGLDVIVDSAGNDTVLFASGLTPDRVAARIVTENGVSMLRVRLLDRCGDERADQGFDMAMDAAGTLPVENFLFADGGSATLADLLVQTEYHDGDSEENFIQTGKHDDVIHAGAEDDEVYSGTGHDAVFGGSGNDDLHGQGGKDFLAGGKGEDELHGGHGSDILAGGEGEDELEGGAASDLLIGGQGNDDIEVACGNDIIAFNAGDGRDEVEIEESAEGLTISLGGAFHLADLRLSRREDDLVLRIGSPVSGDDEFGDEGACESDDGAESASMLVFDDWYEDGAGPTLKNGITLQVIEEALLDFAPGSGDPLRDNKVERFDFQGLVQRFDQAQAADPTLSSWALTDAMLDFYLGGSDTEAIGGDLAYQYGKTGSLANIGFTGAQTILANSQFGQASQAIDQVGLSDGAVKLSA